MSALVDRLNRLDARLFARMEEAAASRHAEALRAARHGDRAKSMRDHARRLDRNLGPGGAYELWCLRHPGAYVTLSGLATAAPWAAVGFGTGRLFYIALGLGSGVLMALAAARIQLPRLVRRWDGDPRWLPDPVGNPLVQP